MRRASVAYPARSVASNGRESNAPSGPRRSLSATSRRRHGGLVTAAGRQGTAEVPTVSSAGCWMGATIAVRLPWPGKNQGGFLVHPGLVSRVGHLQGRWFKGPSWTDAEIAGRRLPHSWQPAGQLSPRDSVESGRAAPDLDRDRGKGGVRSQPRWAGAADCHGDDRWVGQVGGAQANIGPCCLLGAGNPCWKREVGGRPGHRTSHGHGGGRAVTTKRSSGGTGDAVPAAMARIAADFAEAESVPVSLLGDYLQVLVGVAETGRRLTAASWRPAASMARRRPGWACPCGRWWTPT
jgi:hypothetical protein